MFAVILPRHPRVLLRTIVVWNFRTWCWTEIHRVDDFLTFSIINGQHLTARFVIGNPVILLQRDSNTCRRFSNLN